VLKGCVQAALLSAVSAVFLLSSALASDRMNAGSQLDRVGYAVEGAESSHGRNPAMWRPQPAGPQGPMQVSEKAAIDVGGGDRFDAEENRAIGRAYLALLFRNYGNWPDAISAYNWGRGRLDKWIRAGRRPEKMVSGVSRYLHHVLRDSGICNNQEPAAACEATGSSTPPAFSVQRRPVMRPIFAKALALAAQFGAEQTRLDRTLARSQ
jgi:transglycosylase-like protein with SLT domain